MLQKVANFIQDQCLILPGDKVIVGLSGGADSVALLHILKELRGQLKLELFAAHINHCIRGQEAINDAVFAEDLCKSWNIPFFLKIADIPELSRRLNLTEEEAGRQVRYDFFYEVMDKVKGNRIATAHHKNDQAETILHNIIRGTGIQGLSGIKPIRDGCIIRPLLVVTREEILDYIKMHSLSYREDATNADLTYTRNRIRNRLIPILTREYNPDIIERLYIMGNIIREEDEFLTDYCSKVYRELCTLESGQIIMHLNKFNACHGAVQKRLVRLAVSKLRGDLDGVGYDHIDAVVTLARRSRTGTRTLVPASGKGCPVIVAEVIYDKLIFRKNNDETPVEYYDELLPVPGQVRLEKLGLIVTAEKWDRKKSLHFSSQCIYIDEDAVKGSLRLRQRVKGDRFKPLGMNGSKKLKDYFIDMKIPRDERDRIPLLVDEENIIWVVGLQLNQDYRITGSTKNILKISIEYQRDNGG
ncbi:MAG TPA: tRNA lysidine(34) synthetase TilS [Clostridiales bacterium]|nr:tRNA lysidine(34) synthetase TilS [Clostridiales bacterium]